MKHVISLIICILLVFSVCTACGKTEEIPEAQIQEEPAARTEEPAQGSEEEPEAEETAIPDGVTEAVFRGVLDYGKVDHKDVQTAGNPCYLFEIDGEVINLAIKYTPGFRIQNLLMEGYNYSITIEDETVTDAELLDEMTAYEPVIQAEPGLRTLKNFLATCFEPMGTALYVYGGSWNWQDNGSSVQSTHIGVPGTWVDFYQSQDASYAYADDYHKSTSYYPYGGWNEYYYAGTDCSGYAGWAVYNTLNTEDGNQGYVTGATAQGRLFAEEYDLGIWTNDPFNTDEDPLQPGDMISTPSHIWICIGRCEDGSIVAIHSTVTNSSTGREGGGVQLSAINPESFSKNCDAYRLACEYTERYFPDWAERYPVVMKSYKKYVDFEHSSANAGRFRWSLDGTTGLSDPEAYADMSAEEVLKDLFGE